MPKWVLNEDGHRGHVQFQYHASDILTRGAFDCATVSGRWRVWENLRLVACGQMSSDDPRWQGGVAGLQREVERVMCYGPTALDRRAAAIFARDNPSIHNRLASYLTPDVDARIEAR